MNRSGKTLTILEGDRKEYALRMASDLPIDAEVLDSHEHFRQWPRHVRNETELEYRRFRALEFLFSEDDLGASGLVLQFWRFCFAIGGSCSSSCNGSDSDIQIEKPHSRNAEKLGERYRQIFRRPLPVYWTVDDAAKLQDAASPYLL
jgi:hypothetical protein